MNFIYKQGYVGRRVFGRLQWLERLSYSQTDSVVDVERFGLRWRLQRFGNVSESRLLRRADSFEKYEIEFVLGQVSDDFVFIDVGANCGYWSLRVAQQLRGGGQVIAVEPQPVMLERLRYNVWINSIKLITVFDCAVGDRADCAMLTVDKQNLGRSRVSDDGSVSVAMRTLMDIVHEKDLDHINAIKVDVEGFEDRVLGPFLRDAPEALLPKVIVAECSWSDCWQSDWQMIAHNRGYWNMKWTRNHNIIMVRDY